LDFKEVAEAEQDKNHQANLEGRDLSFLYFHLSLDLRLGWFGGGGGGARSSFPLGLGGIGGGGNGIVNDVSAATTGSANTGGGGGGAYFGGGAKGGSGIVIIRYPGPPIATGGTITSVDGDTIHTFTATGSHTFTVL
jgi:hypothetical protein